MFLTFINDNYAPFHFQVVSFDNLEDDEIEDISPAMRGRDWDDIIPEKDRKRVEDEERQKEILHLHLPPRQRKKLQPVRGYILLLLFARSQSMEQSGLSISSKLHH
jgi:hypothetical protein